jgi:hypothetical protein
VEQSSIQPVRGLQSTAAGREFGGRYISLLRGHFHPSPQGIYSVQLSLFTFNLIFETLCNTHLSLVLVLVLSPHKSNYGLGILYKAQNCFLRTFSKIKVQAMGEEAKSHFHYSSR